MLLEHNRKAGILHGFTDNYIRIELKGSGAGGTKVQEFKGLDNTIVQVRLGEWNEKGDALKGEIVNGK